ncbi:MAG: bifunctional phosphoribosylaminoimidazolecarboxamide formyltransferase/IMP cyclohydrolase [Bacteroidales bacterium]|nr:bifunctional phosphoribosylaminoimidazolecarboxamide formyltransferase/IMP cyclohydrolase [Bacteroidales bacterium]
MKKIRNALLTVYDKNQILEIAGVLRDCGVRIFSTGGTFRYLQENGMEATDIEEITGFPSIFGGRVKTLHPGIMGGILYRREEAGDVRQAEQYHIPAIDLVVVDLYPFEETLAHTDDTAEIIEKIDIGGISLIRASAKNYRDVLCCPSKEYYGDLIRLLQEGKGETTEAQRRQFAERCFRVSSHYDTAIHRYFEGGRKLRYGENPHQQAMFYGNLDEAFEQLNGKEISYNNLVDVDAAVSLVSDLDSCAFAVIKHTNACGVAQRPTLLQAWTDALACDPVSAFGGVLACNARMDAATAAEINKLFFEVLIAPDFDPEALEVLKSKKNRILLRWKGIPLPVRQCRTLLNGELEQDRDVSIESQETLAYPTEARPDAAALEDLFFANKLVKHTKSNAIVLVKNKQLLASGMGQTSRVDALRQAVEKAHRFHFDLRGAVLASDAYFPFRDCVDIAAEEGVSAIMQPGGSIRDQESIDACNEHHISMVFTGVRHFKH